MYLKRRTKNPFRDWMIGTIVVMLLLFLIAFWKEIIQLPQAIMVILRLALSGARPAAEDRSLHNAVVLFFTLFCSFIPAFLLMTYVVASQALLPVTTFQEKIRTGYHLLLHLFGRHGQAVFIKDGKVVETEEDRKAHGEGVIVVDFNSAVVLEERFHSISNIRPRTQPGSRLLRLVGLNDPFVSPRAHGAGIVFTRPRERIRGVVDLRKQNRSKLNVKGYTRDGIELTTVIWSLFSVAHDPQIIQVTYQDRVSAENLRVMNLARKPGTTSFQIVSLDDELDKADRDEIHEYATQMFRSGPMVPYEDLPQPPLIPDYRDFRREDSPFRHRVFSAVFTQARDEKEELIPWEDLPPMVAADFFRELIQKYNYDQLFKPLTEGGFPISELRKQFRIQVRNSGLLNYRLVLHASRRPLSPNITINGSSMLVSPVQSLQNNKVLRERGISILACGFADLKPPDAVYDQRLDNWRARWEQETSIARSNHELEAMRVRTRARVQAQRELRYDLMRIINATEYPQEVLALRVLQALESAAADPKTRQLLPGDTMRMMDTLRAILAGNPPPPPPPPPNPKP